MTDTFREIEKGHEAKFKLDEELRFKVRSRRNKLFGLWAAGKLGMTDGEASSYARSLVRHELDAPGTPVVFETVMRDLCVAGIDIGDAAVRSALDECDSVAMAQVRNEYPMPLDRDHAQVGG